MHCLQCDAVIQDGKKFCSQCGAPAALRCVRCGSENPPANRFCGNRGAELQHGARTTAPAARTSVERRQLTVLFCDLVGSTGLSARLDPEDLRALTSRYRRCIAETVAPHNGFVAQHLGDGALVYFGYPQAREDDTELAVLAALELVQAIAALPTKEKLTGRIGIATGVVVVGDLSEAEGVVEHGALGETPNLAARLQYHRRVVGVFQRNTTMRHMTPCPTPHYANSRL